MLVHGVSTDDVGFCHQQDLQLLSVHMHCENNHTDSTGTHETLRKAAIAHEAGLAIQEPVTIWTRVTWRTPGLRAVASQYKLVQHRAVSSTNVRPRGRCGVEHAQLGKPGAKRGRPHHTNQSTTTDAQR
jgi:hypothetical protein